MRNYLVLPLPTITPEVMAVAHHKLVALISTLDISFHQGNQEPTSAMAVI